jgi:hypothetical protein
MTLVVLVLCLMKMNPQCQHLDLEQSCIMQKYLTDISLNKCYNQFVYTECGIFTSLLLR